jgi:hypothetical protein
MRAGRPSSRSIGIVIATLALAVVATACSDQPSREDRGECSSAAEEGEGGFTAFVPRGESWKPPLMQSLAVFQGEREVSDRLPPDDCGVGAALDLAGDTDTDDPPGRALVGQSRLALGPLPEDRRVFVVPTARGGVCGIVTEPGAHSFCGNGSDSPGVSYWNPKVGNPFVWGVLPNEIAALEVRTGGRRSKVPVRRNAFYFQFDREVRFSGNLELVALYRDGSKQTIG